MIWEAKSQMQRDVLESDAMIVCAGGSAGTYKSERFWSMRPSSSSERVPFPLKATSKRK